VRTLCPSSFGPFPLALWSDSSFPWYSLRRRWVRVSVTCSKRLRRTYLPRTFLGPHPRRARICVLRSHSRCRSKIRLPAGGLSPARRLWFARLFAASFALRPMHPRQIPGLSTCAQSFPLRVPERFPVVDETDENQTSKPSSITRHINRFCLRCGTAHSKSVSRGFPYFSVRARAGTTRVH